MNMNVRGLNIMATGIAIKHKESGMMKTGLYGFSWTYLFFGWFVPLFRGELGVGALHLLFTVLTALLLADATSFETGDQA